MHSKNSGHVIALAIITLTIVGFAIFMTTAKAETSETLPDDVKAMLSDYNEFIETGSTSRKVNYSAQMDQLAAERRTYYQEFFNKGLHSDLVSLESRFITEKGVTITQAEDTYYISIAERVTLHGKPITTSPDDYPLIQAARWAVNQTSDEGVKSHLNQYIASMTKGVEDSVNNGVHIVFSVKHNMEIRIINGQANILKDTFSDKSSDNEEGFDNVTWTENHFSRRQPDWQKMPDYEMYNVSNELIGEKLLKDYEAAFSSSALEAASSINFETNREKAVWYIQYYTSNPTPMHLCPDGITLVYRYSAFYNASYSYLWSHPDLECLDCTDYVSQALHHGGFPTDDIWKPEVGNPAWTGVAAFQEYFSSLNRGSMVTSLMSLVPGDVAFVYNNSYLDPWRHVVMYSSINPSGYSGHTNDRKNYPFSSDLNEFLIIHYNGEIIFLPLILNGSTNNSIMQENTQDPYPAPDESFRVMPESDPYPAP